jgi:hypothetical protein
LESVFQNEKSKTWLLSQTWQILCRLICQAGDSRRCINTMYSNCLYLHCHAKDTKTYSRFEIHNTYFANFTAQMMFWQTLPAEIQAMHIKPL